MAPAQAIICHDQCLGGILASAIGARTVQAVPMVHQHGSAFRVSHFPSTQQVAILLQLPDTSRTPYPPAYAELSLPRVGFRLPHRAFPMATGL